MALCYLPFNAIQRRRAGPWLADWADGHLLVAYELVTNWVLALHWWACDSACVSDVNQCEARNPVKKRKRSQFGKDKRRKHRHWQVTVFYRDGEKFARVYTDREKATKFAERQKKSPVVKTARVLQIG